jgi:anti-sigma-K factor RskA
MTDPEKLVPDDAMLVRYLLGALPADEAEPIEEASVVDDELAARLNTLENDLVDSYVRGELEGRKLAQFHSWYMSSPRRMRKVGAAKAFLAGAYAAPEKVSAEPENVTAKVQVVGGSQFGTLFGAKPPDAQESKAPRLSIWRMALLGLAAAAAILIAAVAYLSYQNKQLHKEVAGTKQETTALTAQLNEKHAAAAVAVDKNNAPARLADGLNNVATVALFLSAPTRGTATVPKIDVPPGTGLVVLSLGLGGSGEDAYRAELMDPPTHRVVWHSGILRPGSDGTFVSVSVPAQVLRSQMYLVELLRDGAKGAPEPVATYPFRAEVK